MKARVQANKLMVARVFVSCACDGSEAAKRYVRLARASKQSAAVVGVVVASSCVVFQVLRASERVFHIFVFVAVVASCNSKSAQHKLASERANKERANYEQRLVDALARSLAHR